MLRLFAVLSVACVALAQPAKQPVQGRTKLNTGQMMTLVNCGGTAPGHGGTAKQDHFSNYTEWLRQGGRGIDTALTYTDPLNAKINAAMKWAAGPGKIPREDIWLTTKVPCCSPGSKAGMRGFCQQPEYAGTIAVDMAKNNALLGTTYTDLTLLHHPCDTVAHTIDRYVEMQTAMEAGHTKAIGVSNFNAELLAQVMADKRVKTVPAVNQCNHAIANHNESHNVGGGGDDKTVEFCKSRGIAYSAFSPLEGLSGQDVFKIPQVVAIGKAHKKSAAQVALRWLVQQNISAVTAAHNPAYIAEDIDIFDFELTVAEMATLAKI